VLKLTNSADRYVIFALQSAAIIVSIGITVLAMMISKFQLIRASLHSNSNYSSFNLTRSKKKHTTDSWKDNSLSVAREWASTGELSMILKGSATTRSTNSSHAELQVCLDAANDRIKELEEEVLEYRKKKALYARNIELAELRDPPAGDGGTASSDEGDEMTS